MDADTFLAEVAPHRQVMALLAARLAPRTAPSEIVQAAYAAAHRHRARFDPRRGSLRLWLLAITADCARSTVPGRRSRTIAPTELAPSAEGLPEPSALDEAVAALPERLRSVVDCVHYVGLSVDETAGLLRDSERSVRTALADAQRRVRTAAHAGPDEPGGAQLLESAGAVWREEFLQAPLPDLLAPTAPQTVPADTGAESDIDSDTDLDSEGDDTAWEPVPASGAAGEPEPEQRRKRPWLLPTLVFVLFLALAGTLSGIRAVKAAEIATLEQQDRDRQLCGQVPPGLDRITVTRVGQPSGDGFEVRSVAKDMTSVYAAQVTGVDASGRIATYLKHDVVTQDNRLIAVLRVVGQPTFTRTTLAQDRCDGTASGVEGLTDHLIVHAFVDSRSLVMDAGPVDELDVTGF